MKGVHGLRHVSPRLTTGPGVVAAIALGMLFAGPRPALAIPIPIGFISWDVTIPGATGQFDIANETAANSSGDPTFPVMTPVGLRNLALDVSLSDGTMRHFGAADFILNPFDGLSVEGPVIAIGGQNPRPVQARLTGTFLPLNFTLFDNSMWTTAPGFSALVTNGGAPLVDGDLALVFADAALISTRLPDIPEPGTLLLTISGLLVVLAGRATKWRDRRTAPRRRAGGAARPLVFILGLTLAAASTVTAQVRMNVSAQPSAGIGGSSTVNAIGSAFPAGTGTIDASNITVSLATSCGGPVVATAVATSARVATGNQYRVGFTLPGTLIAGNYYITLAGITSGGTSFASAPDSCSEVHVTHADPVLAACTQSGPLAIRANPTGGSVTAYAPNGCWDDACTQTGVQKVALEGDGAPITIPTPQVVSLCATNPVTNKTVCLGDTDVYVIENDAVTATLHSASDGQGRISGGLCNNCGIAIDPVTNRAVISIGLTYSAAQPFRSGLQFLDLNTNTFSPPFKSADYVAEHISIDPLRGYILSPNEQGNYNLFGYSTGGVASEFSNHLAGFRELDSPAEDCSTGIALGALENVFGGVFVADLTQATFTPGTPGTWAAMQQIVTLSDVPFEPTGVAVAQGSHLGILTPEYTAGGAFAVIRLPDASGAGTPTIVDYAVGTIPGFAGTPDPHSVSTYTSPNDGRAYGVVASGFPPTALARIDLACVLELPRNAGKHTTSRSSECITIRNTGNVPAGPPTIASTPLTSAVAGREYVYNVKAVDPHNFVLTYSLPAAPEGMVVNPANGQIQWSPEVNQAGAHAVTVMARNPEGLTGTQSFQVIVTVVPNRPPVITSFPVIVATVGQLYSYQLHATDPDNRPLTYALLSWPEGMSIVPQTGLIQWTPTLNQARPAAVTVLVQNDRGLSSSQSFKIFVPVPQNQPPVITSTAVTSATVGVLYVYQLRAADPNDDPIAYSFVAVPFGMTIDSVTGLIHWTPTSDDVGDWSVTLRAQDPSRSVATQSFHLQVQRAYPVPTIAVISPAPNSTLGKPVDVVATISDPSPGDPPVSWQVDLARGDGTARTVASGTGAIAGGTVARIDPTLIRDDSYSLVITVSRLGQVDRQSFDYSVLSGNLKLGNFKTSFTDIAIPVAGIPMVITRVYDSLDTGPGEFGAGWRLGLPGQVTDSARETPLEPFTRRTRVYVTRPDGRRVGFTFRPLKPSPFPIWLPGFSPDPGVTDTLSVEPTDLDDALGNFYEFLGGPYNPRTYTLTTREGVQYVIDERDGLQQITDRNGNTLQVTREGLISSTGLSLPFERDNGGRIAKITEPGGGFVRYAYDVTGNLVSSFDQMGNETKYKYEEPRFPHYLTRIDDPLGRPLTRNMYDQYGRLIAECGPFAELTTLQGCTRFEAEATAKSLTIVNERAYRTDFVFDDRGNTLIERRWLEDGRPLTTTRTYDAASNLLTELDPDNALWTYSYDQRGNALTQRNPTGGVDTRTYNSCNEVATDTDASGITINYVFDERCNLTKVIDPLGKTTEYRYDAQGQPIEFIDRSGAHWRRHYDEFGRLSGITDPFGKTTSAAFSPSGDLKVLVNRNGKRIDFEYDGAHKMVAETWNSVPKYEARFAYDANGQLVGATSPENALRVEYDAMGRLALVESAATAAAARVSMEYTYDAAGNAVRVRDSVGGSTEYAHDAIGRVSNVTQAGLGINPKRVELAYTDADLLTDVRRFADVAGTIPVANTHYEYSCAGGCVDRLAAIRHRRPDNSVIHDMTFDRSAVGNITASSDSEGIHQYAYDELRRLVAATHFGSALQRGEFYRYDQSGNRITSQRSATYVYSDNGHRLIEDDSFIYHYDDEGNVVRRVNKVSGEYVEYAYDHKNRVVSAAVLTAQHVEQARESYGYDAIGRFFRVSIGGAPTYRFYDDSREALILDVAGTVLVRRLNGPGPDEVVAEDRGGATRWVMGDQVGTVRDVSITGGVAEHYIYDSFGNRLAGGVPPLFSPQFGGRESSRITDASLFFFRWFDSGTGRFLSEDLLPEFGYSYAGDNPISLEDRFGLSAAEDATIKTGLPAKIRVIACLAVIAGTEYIVGSNALAGNSLSDALIQIVAGAAGAAVEKQCLPTRPIGLRRPKFQRPRFPTPRNTAPNPLANPTNPIGTPRSWRR